MRTRDFWLLRATGMVFGVGGVAALVGGLAMAPAGRAAEAHNAEATLVDLTIADIPAIPVHSYDGEYGTAGTPDLSQPSDRVAGDFSDPDGVLRYVIVSGTEVVETSWDNPPGQLTARTNATGFELGYQGNPDFLTAGSVDSYARCIDRVQGSALAYARTDGVATTVLGQQVPFGVTTDIEVTGDQLNLPGVTTGTITVHSNVVENVTNEPSLISAEAYLHYEVTAELYDENGLVYRGPLFAMNVGHVKAECVPPDGRSASPTRTPTETPSEIPSETPSGTPTGTPTSPTETPTSPTETPTSPSESPSVTPVVPTEAPTAPELPITGRATGPLLVIGAVAIVGGGVLLWLTRRNPTGSTETE